MGLKLEYAEGSTPLDLNEIEGLIPALGSQGELNEFEFLNISEALLWSQRQRKAKSQLLSIAMLKEIHLPSLERVTKYLHIHDNAVVSVVDLGKLKEVGGEVSFSSCPALKAARIASAAAPAKATALVIKACGMPAFPGAHVKA